MNFGRVKVGSIIGAVLVPVLGLLLLVPSAALAEEPFATVTAWEIQEFLRFKTGDDEDSIVRRLGNATLVGHATDGLCALAGQNPCALDGRARSSVDLSTGLGPISGTFDILLDTNPGSPLLMDLVLAGTVEFDGVLDLRPALFGGAPVALASGTWKSKKLHARGSFSATFLIPIPDSTGTCGLGLAYYNPFAGTYDCLAFGDFSLGAPVVKVTAELTKKAKVSRGNHRDDD
jgi:hypothetical protein